MNHYCERLENAKSVFDERSFRWKVQSKKVRILVGCPKGKWQPRKQRCKVGLRAYKVLKQVGPRTKCRAGSVRLKKPW